MKEKYKKKEGEKIQWEGKRQKEGERDGGSMKYFI